VQGALKLWVRSDWRRRWRALVVLALFAGIAGAVVLAAAAGARRTGSSFERLAEESRPADVIADVGAVDPDVVKRITTLSIVDVVGAVTVVFAVVDGVDTDLAILAPLDSRVGSQIESDRIVRGRRPDPSSVDEMVVNESTAEILGVDVGDEVSIATLTPEQVSNEAYFPAQGPTLRVEVVGVARGPTDLIPSAEGGFLASPAFLASVSGQVDEWTTYLRVGLVEGATVAEFEAALAAIIPSGQEYETVSFDVRSRAARGSISAVASGLVVFSIVAAVAAVVALGQAVGRHVISAQSDEETLRELGVTRTGRTVGLVLLTVPAAAGGAALAVAAAWLVSPLMPIGLARRAEPDPGFSADWVVLLAGGLAVIVVVVASATITAGRLTLTHRGARAEPGPSAVASAISRMGAGPVAVSGARLALDRRAPALPVRSAIAGVTVAILGTVGVLTFSASLDRAVAAPARWGYGWDLLLNFNSGGVGVAAERLVGDDRMAAVARWDAGFSYVDGDGLSAYGLAPLKGDLGFSLRSGRQPVSPGEVVLGPETASRLGVQLGEQIDVAPESNAAEPASVIVVGTALFPDDGEGSFTDGIGYLGPAFQEHAIVPDLFEASQIVVRVMPGLDLDDLTGTLNDEYSQPASSGENLPLPPDEVANLSNIRSLPRWLAAFVAFLGIASLGHVLLTTLVRRRAELATLRGLGLTPGQVRSCFVGQALTITLVGLLIGVPLGIAAGSGAWFVVADPIGIATDASRPLLAVSMTGVAALVIAALVALIPGWRASRLRPAESLRTE
jgi:hypothetical protein